MSRPEQIAHLLEAKRGGMAGQIEDQNDLRGGNLGSSQGWRWQEGYKVKKRNRFRFRFAMKEEKCRLGETAAQGADSDQAQTEQDQRGTAIGDIQAGYAEV